MEPHKDPGVRLAIEVGIAGENIARCGHHMLHANQEVITLYLISVRKALSKVHDAVTTYEREMGAENGHYRTADATDKIGPDHAEASGSGRA